jgi:hypothetical protein
MAGKPLTKQKRKTDSINVKSDGSLEDGFDHEAIEAVGQQGAERCLSASAWSSSRLEGIPSISYLEIEIDDTDESLVASTGNAATAVNRLNGYVNAETSNKGDEVKRS